MSSVDERVVEMRFDNAQFERGVQKTLLSLDKLKEGLKFNGVENGIGIIQRAINSLQINKISKNIEDLNGRFSAIGIAGMEVVKRLTNAALDAVTKVATAIPKQINQGGWSRAMNIETAKFQLSGLGVAWDSINKDIQYAVNGTAYGLDAAAKVASQLTASGIKVDDSIKLTAKNVDDMAQSLLGVDSATAVANGDLDDMSVALRAISGVAAMTNSSYEDIGQVFTRVAGQGKVMATDLNSLAARGLNAAATIGDALGMTESEVREAVHDGEISFEIFADAMYDAFADHAVKANETLDGALANTKSALSRIGADVADDIIPALTKVLNSCRILFNNVHKWIQPVLDSISRLATVLGTVVSGFIDKVNAKVESFIGTTEGPVNAIASFIDTVTGKVESLGTKISGSASYAADAVEEVADAGENLIGVGYDIDEMAKQVIRGLWGNQPEREKRLEEAGYSFALIQNKVNEMLGCSKRYEVQTADTTNAIAEQTAAIDKQVVAAENLKHSIGDNLKNGLLDLATTIGYIVSTIGHAIADTARSFKKIRLEDLAKPIQAFADTMHNVVNNMSLMADISEVIYNIIGGIGNVIKAAGQILKAFGMAIVETFREMKKPDIKGVSEAFYSLTESLILSEQGVRGLANVFKILLAPLRVIVPLISFLKKVILQLLTALAKLNSKFLEFLGITNPLKKLGKIAEDVFYTIAGGILLAVDAIGKFFKSISKPKKVDSFGASLANIVKTVGKGFVRAITLLGKAIAFVITSAKNSEVVQNLAKAFVSLGKAVGKRLTQAINDAANGFEKIKKNKVVATIVDSIGRAFKQAAIHVTSFVDGLAKLVSGDIKIKDVFDGLASSFSNMVDTIKGGDFLSNIYDFIFGKDGTIDAMPDVTGEVNKTIEKTQKTAVEETKKTDFNAITTSVTDKIVKGFKSINPRTIGESIRKVVVGIIGWISKTVTDGIEVIDWKGVGEAISKSFTNLFEGFKKAFKKGKVTEFVKEISEIVLPVIGIIKALSLVNLFHNWAKVGKSLSEFITSISDPFNMNNKFPKKSKIRDFTECILMLAGAITALSLLNKYAGVDVRKSLNQIEELLLIMAAISVGLGAANKWMNRNRGASSLGKMIKEFSISVDLLIAGMYILGKMDSSEIAQAKEVLIELIGSTGLIMIVAEVFNLLTNVLGKGKFGNVNNIGEQFLAMAGAVDLLVLAVLPLGTLPFKILLKGVTGLIILLDALGVATGTANWLSKKIGKDNSSWKSILAMAGAALMVAHAILPLAIIAHFDFKSLLIAVGSMCAVIVALGFGLGQASKWSEQKGSWIGILAMCAVTLSITYSLLALVDQPWQGLLAAVLSLGAVLLALGKAMSWAGDTAASAGSLFGMAAAVIALALALTVLSEVEWDKLKYGLGGLAIAMGIFIGSILALDYLSIFVLGLVPTLLAMSAAVVALASSLYLLSKIQFKDLRNSLIVFGIAIGIVVAALWLVKAPIIAISAAMTISTPAIIAFAAAIVAVCVAVVKLASIFGKSANDTEKSTKKTSKALKDTADTAKTSSASIKDSTSGIGDWISENLLGGTEGMLPGLTNVFSSAKTSVVSGMLGLNDGLVGGFGTMQASASTGTAGLESIMTDPTGFSAASGANMQALMEKYQNGEISIDELMNQINVSSQSTLTDTEGYGSAGEGNANAYISKANEAFNNGDTSGAQHWMDLLSNIFGDGNGGKDGKSKKEKRKNEAAEEIRDERDKQAAITREQAAAAQQRQWNQDHADQIARGKRQAAMQLEREDYVTHYSSQTYNAQVYGHKVAQNYVDSNHDGIISGEEKTDAAIKTVGDSALEQAQKYPALYGQTGAQDTAMWAYFMAGARPKLRNAAKIVGDAGVAQAQQDAANWRMPGENSGSKYSEGAGSKSNQSKMKSSVTTLGNAGLAAANGQNGILYNAGINIGIGLGEGISTAWKFVRDKVTYLASKVKQTFMKGVDENSPSKIFMQYGKWIDMGLANGISGNTDIATDATSNLAQSSLDVMRSSIAGINSIMSSDADISPTITPVVDLSNVRQSASAIDGMFDTTSIRANAVAGSFTPQTVQTMDLLRREMSNLTDQLSKELQNGMNNSDQTYTFVTNTQLDGRQIARSTATYTQQELNRLNKLNQRMEGYR